MTSVDEHPMTPDTSRIYSDVQAIDYSATHGFWEQRAEFATKVNPLSLTMFQDDKPEFVEARDRHEKATVVPQLRLTPEMSVLDVGCGVGRWGMEIIDKVGHYHGFDFSSGLVRVGKEQLKAHFESDRFSLQALSATEMSSETLEYPGPFHLFLVTGLMVYLNDEDVRTMLGNLARIASSDAQLFVREPITIIKDRLTLDRHFSSELGSDYSAVYRSRSEYSRFFAECLAESGFEIRREDFLYSDALNNRAETAQYYWILERVHG